MDLRDLFRDVLLGRVSVPSLILALIFIASIAFFFHVLKEAAS